MSDSRTASEDESGSLLRAVLRGGGFDLGAHELLPDEPDELRALLKYAFDASLADAIVITGGTGISPRDRTIEAIEPMFDKHLDGFGEAFRRLSFDQIGPRAILSRATMGVVRGSVVVALPGSPAAVKLAAEALLVPMLSHAIDLARGRDVSRSHADAGSARSKNDAGAG